MKRGECRPAKSEKRSPKGEARRGPMPLGTGHAGQPFPAVGKNNGGQPPPAVRAAVGVGGIRCASYGQTRASGPHALRPAPSTPSSLRRFVAPSLFLLPLALIALATPALAADPLAYIGPGAGIALAGSLFAVIAAIFAGIMAMLLFPLRFLWRLIRGRRTMRNAKVKRVVVVGLDGLEPSLTEKWMAEGLLPNLAKIKARGSYLRLGTTWPPLSPVAWSSFTTGCNPGKHNIFDFISRTPNYQPTISSVRIRGPRRKIKLGGYFLPLGKAEITPLRRSKPFWTILGEHGVFSAIQRVPITFPPDKFRGVQLSAMCVPDLRGTQGMFSYYIEEGEAGTTTEGDVGGDRILVHRLESGEVRSFLRGPRNDLRVEPTELRIPFRVTEGGSNGADATLHIDGQKIPLKIGQYTPWVHVGFRPAPWVKLRGICRFMLKRFERPFEMYCTPLQIDPDKPVMPIAQPYVYSCYLARLCGPYATLGLAEDTWSLSEGLMSEEGFLEQAYDIHAERERMFFDALEKVRRGCVVCVFDGPDRIQHMFWRFIDPNHPAATDAQREKYGDVLRQMYVRMDELVGRVLEKVGDDPDTALFVMSDHGFKPFRRGVDLNAWLRDEGYLKLKDGKQVAEKSYLKDIDFEKTRAYAVGLAGIFINEKGREAHGIVEPSDARRLAAEIAEKLTGLRDPATGEVAVHEAVVRERVYKGPYRENAPDIIVGYNVGYRVSWEAAIGKCGAEVFSDNTKAWSGDHCVHPQLVPGVLFTNLRIDVPDAEIIDLAPTVLELFGIRKPAHMDGRSLLDPGRAAKSAEKTEAPAAVAVK